jgi:DNA-binding transcriptional ArsR family regulator
MSMPASMAETARATDPAPIFAALGDRTRLSLLMRLSDGRTRSITMLAADTDLTRQAVTKHLRVLQDVGLVESVRHGRESRYACRPEPLDMARAYLDRVAAQWDDALLRLKAFVEE